MKKLLLACACVLSLASCSSLTTPLTATSNPVGNKVGESSYTTYCWGMFGKRNADIGINKAAKEAGITKISHADLNSKRYGFFGARKKVTTRVYGE